MIFPRLDVEIDGSNHFNAIPIGLVVEFSTAWRG